MTRLRIASVGGVPEGGSTCIEMDEFRLAVFNVDGKIHVIDDRCTHAEASLSEGEVFDGEVECPRHGAVFDLATGQVRSLPATRPVVVYPVAIEGDGIYIDVEERE